MTPTHFIVACSLSAFVHTTLQVSADRPRFPQKPQFGSTDLLVTVCSFIFALPPVRWKLSFTVPCQEGNTVRETSQTLPSTSGVMMPVIGQPYMNAIRLQGLFRWMLYHYTYLHELLYCASHQQAAMPPEGHRGA